MYSVTTLTLGRVLRDRLGQEACAADRARPTGPAPATTPAPPTRARAPRAGCCRRPPRARRSPRDRATVKPGPVGWRCTTRKPSSDLPEKIGVDIVEPRARSDVAGQQRRRHGHQPARRHRPPHRVQRREQLRARRARRARRAAGGPSRAGTVGVRDLGPQHRDRDSEPLRELRRRVRHRPSAASA